MKILSRFTLGSILLLCAAQAVWAFGIEPVVNGVGAEHQRITRAAIDGVDAQTLAWLAGTDEEPGAVGLPDVEGAQDLAALHCDNGDYLAPASDEPPYAQTEAEAEAALTACRALSFAELDRAVAAAKPLAAPTSQNTALDCRFDGAPTSAKCEVILHLGLALHIAQDFYAHTNWADQAAQGAHSPTNPPGLAKSGRAAWLDPRAKDIAFPKGLISGCIVNAIALRQCAYGDWALVPFLGAKRVTREDPHRQRPRRPWPNAAWRDRQQLQPRRRRRDRRHERQVGVFQGACARRISGDRRRNDPLRIRQGSIRRRLR